MVLPDPVTREDLKSPQWLRLRGHMDDIVANGDLMSTVCSADQGCKGTKVT